MGKKGHPWLKEGKKRILPGKVEKKQVKIRRLHRSTCGVLSSLRHQEGNKHRRFRLSKREQRPQRSTNRRTVDNTTSCTARRSMCTQNDAKCTCTGLIAKSDDEKEVEDRFGVKNRHRRCAVRSLTLSPDTNAIYTSFISS